jgi:hypothetical protein
MWYVVRDGALSPSGVALLRRGGFGPSYELKGSPQAPLHDLVERGANNPRGHAPHPIIGFDVGAFVEDV